MRNLLNFLSRHHNLIIFIILEGLALFLLTTRNDYHNTRVVKGFRGVTTGIDESIFNARSYLSLRKANILLMDENIALKNTMNRLNAGEPSSYYPVVDSVYNQQFNFTGAEVINNSVNRQKNFITLNKGKKDGVDVDMAVTTNDGVTGIIVGSSDNFSVAMSLLNLDFRLSARIRSNGYFGSLSWDGRNTGEALLSEIPQHAPVVQGDTIETTAYSAIFPEGIMIGTISNFERSGSDFYSIRVSLATDFSRLTHVNIIGNLRREEQLQLENQFQ